MAGVTSWTLSIDIGTTATAAAMEVDGERTTVELDGRSRMASTVFATAAGELVVGEAAEAQAAVHPAQVERTPKRRLGDPVVLLGDHGFEPVDLVAAMAGHVARTAAALVGGAAPSRLVLTHPARWGAARLDLLRAAAARAGLPHPDLVSEPVAAAAHLAADVVQPGGLLAVYDLGGGTFDAAVVRRQPDGFEVAGPPGGDETSGGEALDELVLEAVQRRFGPEVASSLAHSPERIWQQARVQLRQGARQAKEALSTSDDFQGYLGAPVDQEWRLTSAELATLAQPTVAATVRALLDTIRRAGVSPAQLEAVVMVGGGARMPLVPLALRDALQREPTTWGDPKAVVSLGALKAVRRGDDVALSAVPAPIIDPSSAAPPAAAEAAPAPPLEAPPLVSPEPVAEGPPASPAAPPSEQDGGWDRRQVGLFVALVLVALGLVCLALLTAGT